MFFFVAQCSSGGFEYRFVSACFCVFSNPCDTPHSSVFTLQELTGCVSFSYCCCPLVVLIIVSFLFIFVSFSNPCDSPHCSVASLKELNVIGLEDTHAA